MTDAPVSVAEHPAIVDHALARGVLYGALTKVLSRPNRGTLESLTSPDGTRAISEAAHLLDSTVREAGSPAETLSAAVLRLHACRTECRDLIVDYDRLFGHTARGLVCPYGTEYGHAALFQQPQTLADIAGFYRAFGLRPSPRTEPRVDHIGVECAFMEFLSLKEAYSVEALEQPDLRDRQACLETLEATTDAGRRFLREHLARFGRAFANTLVRHDQDGFFGSAGALLIAVLELECARLGVPLGPPVLELRSTADDEVPMGCSSGSDLIQIQRGQST